MKNTVLKFLLIFCIILTGSCKKFLDTEPTDFFPPPTYYQTPEQLEFALAGVYDRLGMNRLYGAYLHTLHNMEADEGFFNQRSVTIGIQRYSFTASDPDVLQFYKAVYEGVGRANALLASVDNNVDISEAIRNRVRGEALFLRAYYYFILVQNFENIPMYFKPIANHHQVDVPATPAKDAYEKIIADMETAEALVDPIEKIGFGGRVSKSAVRGILARVCLNMAGEPVNDKTKYEKARYWANEVMKDVAAGHRLNPDYTDIFIKYARDQYDYKESIWEVEHWGNNTDPRLEAGYVGSFIGIGNNATNGVGYSLGRIYSTAKHYNTYEEGDIRRDWNIAPFTYNATTGAKVYTAPTSLYNRYAGKYRREYEALPKNTQPTPINFPLLRYSDVLLMYAEAENELRPGSVDATNALNLVRERAWSTGVKTISITSGGTGYTSAPTVSFTGGNGAGAIATATVSGGQVTSIVLAPNDMGYPQARGAYTSAPTITLIGGGGTGATAVVTELYKKEDARIASGLSRSAFLKIIQAERSRELAFEALRKSDLVRWGMFVETMKETLAQMDSDPGDNTVRSLTFRNASQKHVVYPIPTYELGLNKVLRQHPLWR